MAYSDFTLSELDEKFGVSNQRKRLFGDIKPVPEISDWLKYTLKLSEELPVKSEKAKSELIVMPILIELRNNSQKYFTIYSGDSLNIDDKFKGECDFILAKETGNFDINFPILQVVEAKRNDVEVGIPQCAAQMIGAKMYNQKKNSTNDTIYGCVTTGDDWLFMKLQTHLEIDTKKYYLGNLGELLGVFQEIIGYFKNQT
jgi:hypothetical protein